MKSLKVSSFQSARQLNSAFRAPALVYSYPTIVSVGLSSSWLQYTSFILSAFQGLLPHESMVQSQCLQEWEELMSILCLCVFQKKNGR